MTEETIAFKSTGAIPRQNVFETDEPKRGTEPFRAKHPDYMTYEDRLITFQRWQTQLYSYQILARTGLCYKGVGDKVFCFCCNCEISQWKRGDDPWIRHAEVSPDCTFLRNMKGRDFIASIIPLLQQDENNTSPSSTTETPPIASTSDEDGSNAPGSMLCRICHARELGVVFMPCSHLVSCTRSASKYTTYKICQNPIKVFIRVLIPAAQRERLI